MSVNQEVIPPEISSSNLGPNDGEKPFDPFTPENLRIDQSYLLQAGTKTHLLHVAVRRPRKQEFIQVHPGEEYHTVQALVELDEERDTPYWVPPNLLSEIDPSVYKLFDLYLAINRAGVVFLWKVRIPDSSEKVNAWHSTARDAVLFGKEKWIKLVPDTNEGCYHVEEPVSKLSEPVWPKLPLIELMRLAFKNLVIDGPGHEILKRLRGEI